MTWTRWLALILTVALLAVALLVAGIASIFIGLTELEDGRVIGPFTTVKDSYVAAFIGHTADGTIYLIDAGNDPKGAALLAALAAQGKGPADVQAIFLTHGHQDHIAACALFPNAQVIAMAPEAPMVAGETYARGPIPRWVKNDGSCQVTRPVQDEEVIEMGGTRITGYALPGHTAGSAAWLVDDVLFLGDAASATTSGTLRGGPYPFNDDTPQTDATLQALGSRVPSTVAWLVPAHSGPLEGVAPLRSFTPR